MVYSRIMGRPPKITEEKDRQLKAICRLKPTLADCAAFLDVDTSTIEKYIKRTYGCPFSEFREQNMVHTRFMIIREIIAQCKKGNMTALIYASKNLCGWVDKYESKHEVSKSIDQIVTEAKKIKQKE